MIRINGKDYEQSEIKLSDFMTENNIRSQWVAVELNGAILPKAKYDSTTLVDGDVAEIVNFVGGG